jgi:hypothetical protein
MQSSGASQEILLLDFFACTEVDAFAFTDALGVGFVSAMTLVF